LRTLALLGLLGLAPQLQGCVEMAVVGAGAAALASDDRRSIGAQTEDKDIDLRGESRVNARFGDRVHINVTSYNRNVLLTGEAPDAATREQIERIVREIPNVRGVVNEIQVAGVSSYSARGNDSYLTSKVKARFIDNGGSFSANQVKVVTESSAVYLLGLVTRKEAEAAVEIARTTGGVQKVVRVFEYIEAPAK
jgi:osmotically-inducible protein OsmY